MNVIEFLVRGTPVTQGNMRAFVINGHAVLTHKKGSALAVWRNMISEAAHKAMNGSPQWQGPVNVSVYFSLPPPQSARGHCRCGHGEKIHKPKCKRKECKCDGFEEVFQKPVTRPDIDKLVRAVLDSLTGEVFRDDSQVVQMNVAKDYDVSPGVKVVLTHLTENGTKNDNATAAEVEDW